MDTVAGTVEAPPGILANVINPWLVGADPEFAVLTPPMAVQNSGPYAVEAVLPAGNIGWDHNHRIWELRPAPSTAAYGLVTNMWRLLKDARFAPVEHFKWKSGALGGLHAPGFDDGQIPDGAQTVPDTLGGHIHFGIQMLNQAQKAGLIKITQTLLNLDILPNEENLKRLAQGHYGGFNHDSIRQCGDHCEWRAAPSWLDKPGQALAALTTMKLAAARPSSIDWSESYNLKACFLAWLEEYAAVDVDAWMLTRLIQKRGLGEIQADPVSDFKPRWRREDLWAK
jgi:Phage phiEco32-like COOH.NH2 ligase-type 2